MATNFVWSTSSLPGFKTDRDPPQVPSQEWAAADGNSCFQSLYDIRDAITGSFFFAYKYGVTGDGTTDDAAALQAALDDAARSGSNGSAAYGSFVKLPRGVYSLGSVIDIPNGVGISGAGTSATVLKAKANFSGSALIRNKFQDGTQEFAFLENLQVDGSSGSNAKIGALVQFKSVFVNSYISNVLITNGSNVGLHIAATNALGPILVQNVWCLSNTGHGAFFEEITGNTQAANGIICINLISEHQGNGASAVYLKGLGHSSQWSFYNTHIEMGSGSTGRYGITIDGVSRVLFDGVQLLQTGGVTAGIRITNDSQNVGIAIKRVNNENLINPVIQDLKNNVSIGAINIDGEYLTPEASFRGGVRFTPHTTVGSKSLAIQDSSGNDRVWFDQAGALLGSSSLGAGSLDLVGDPNNDRPVAFINNAKSRVFAWSFPDSSNFRFKYLTGDVNLINFDNSGNGFFYNQTTFQSTVVLQSTLRLQASLSGSGNSAAAPTSGFHNRGEVVFVSDPSASGFIGWVCTAAGTPGTWKTWGAISA